MFYMQSLPVMWHNDIQIHSFFNLSILAFLVTLVVFHTKHLSHRGHFERRALGKVVMYQAFKISTDIKIQHYFSIIFSNFKGWTMLQNYHYVTSIPRFRQLLASLVLMNESLEFLTGVLASISCNMKSPPGIKSLLILPLLSRGFRNHLYSKRWPNLITL